MKKHEQTKLSLNKKLSEGDTVRDYSTIPSRYGTIIETRKKCKEVGVLFVRDYHDNETNTVYVHMSVQTLGLEISTLPRSWKLDLHHEDLRDYKSFLIGDDRYVKKNQKRFVHI